MRVEINADGRQVQIECSDSNVTYEAVADKALEVWKSTSNRDDYPAYGFSAQAVPERPASSSTHRPPGTPR